MINISERMKSYVLSTGRNFKGKIEVGEETLYEGIMSIFIDRTVCSDSFTFGSVNSAYCTVTIFDASVHFAGREISVYISAVFGGTEEWVKLGVFTAEKPEKTDKMITFTAYDCIKYKTDVTYFPTVEAESEITKVFEDVCNQCAVLFVPIESTLTVNTTVLSGRKCKDVLGQIAGFLGGNIVTDNEGRVTVRYFAECDYTVDENMMDEPTISEDTFSLDGITCVSGDITLRCGNTDGNVLNLSNLLMTQEQLESIFERNKNISFNAISVENLVGNPFLEVGDIITVRRYGLEYKAPVMHFTVDFDGGVMNDIECFYKTKEEKLSSVSISEAVKKFQSSSSEFIGAISSALGLFYTKQTLSDGSVKIYGHDKEVLVESTYIFTNTAEGFAFVSGENCWNSGSPQWQYGIDKNGNAILKMLYLYELTADIITAGTLKSKDGNTEFNLDKGYIATKQTTEQGTIETVIANGLSKITQSYVPGEFVFVEPDNWDEMTLAEQIECRLMQIAEFIKNQLAGYHVENTASNTSSSLLADRVVFRQQDGNETYTLEFGLNGFNITVTDNATNKKNKQYILTLISDETYKDCFCHFQNNETEWLNPPMVPGEEYRTMKRYNESAVYTKLVDLGVLPALNEGSSYGIKRVATEAKIDTVVSFQSFAVSSDKRRYTMPFVTNDGSIGCRMTIEDNLEESSVVIRTYAAAMANYTGYAILEYTKKES